MLCSKCGISYGHERSSGYGPNKDVLYSKFPSNVARCRKWVHRVAEPDLVFVPMGRLRVLRFVCSKHFCSEDYTTPKKIRLKSSTVPSIFPPGHKPLSHEEVTQFPLTKESYTQEAACGATSDAFPNLQQNVADQNCDYEKNTEHVGRDG